MLSTQRAAQASLEWFENLGQYVHQEPIQFAFNIMTRSRRVTYDNLRVRDPEFVARCDAWFAGQTAGGRPGRPADVPAVPPRPSSSCPTGSSSRRWTCTSPRTACPTDFHLVHLGGKALGGAGLVMTEMVCVSPEGRITPGCTRLCGPTSSATPGRASSTSCTPRRAAKIGCQLGHSGRKGSTKLMWEGIDEPLEQGNWEVVAAVAAALPAGVNQVPRELTRADLDADRRPSSSTPRRRADAAGFDLLELHCAHGYLLSGFLSPLTNQRHGRVRRRPRRTGCATRSRCSTPMREVWPAHKPMTVRISATDWVEGGIDVDDAVADRPGVRRTPAPPPSTSPPARSPPTSGRRSAGRYQTPYADAIRNRVGIPTIAVGVISSYDDVNSILLAGRADLCALGRAHLYDPSWTLHAAVEQDYDGPGAQWPMPWRAGRRKPQTGRSDGPKPRLQLVREGAGGTRHARWRPHDA